jgi:hypothetical protein
MINIHSQSVDIKGKQFFFLREVSHTFVFSVFSQGTAICVGEKGETPTEVKPTSPIAIAAMAPCTIRPQWLGTRADTISVACITVSFLTLFESRWCFAFFTNTNDRYL